MLADILFQTYRMDCDIACIKASASSKGPEEAFLLPMVNDTLVNVTVKSGPQIVNSMFILINYKSIDLMPL